MSSPRSIVFALDENYVVPFKVAFHSLNTHGRLLSGTRFFLLCESHKLSQVVRDDIRQFTKRYGADICFVECNGRLPSALPISVSDHVTEATFYRLFAASLLPEDIGSVLYLDLDVAVLGDVRFLMELPLHYPLAAVDHCVPGPYKLFGEIPTSYFNAGVAILDLSSWRQQNFESRFIDILNTQRSRLTWWDQDVLNLAFQGNWHSLPVWYNVTNAAKAFVPAEFVSTEVKIIHFDGSTKPWHRHCQHPWKSYWISAYEECFGIPLCFPDPAAELPQRRSLLRRIASKALRELRAKLPTRKSSHGDHSNITAAEKVPE